MKAIVQDAYGPTDVLEFRDIDKPEIADDEVLVGVHAAGVDRGVWHLMTGLPYPIRLVGYGLRAPKTPVPGTDLAGVLQHAFESYLERKRAGKVTPKRAAAHRRLGQPHFAWIGPDARSARPVRRLTSTTSASEGAGSSSVCSIPSAFS